MRTFIMIVMTTVALVGCGRGNSNCDPRVENCQSDSGDIDYDTGDTSNKPTGEIEVNLTYPDGSAVKGVKVGFRDVKSGEPATVPAGEYDVTVDPFEGQGTDWFVADDGENGVSVIADESATVNVELDRFISTSGAAKPIGDQGKDAHTVYSVNCWSYRYHYDGGRQVQNIWGGVDDDPDRETNHGWFSVEMGADGALSLCHETAGCGNFVTNADNGLRVHGSSLALTGDVDGDYPYRMEESTVKSNGDFRFLVATTNTIDADPATYTPDSYLEFKCIVHKD